MPVSHEGQISGTLCPAPHTEVGRNFEISQLQLRTFRSFFYVKFDLLWTDLKGTVKNG